MAEPKAFILDPGANMLVSACPQDLSSPNYQNPKLNLMAYNQSISLTTRESILALKLACEHALLSNEEPKESYGGS